VPDAEPSARGAVAAPLLERRAPTESAEARVEISFPFAEQQIRIPKASRSSVRFKVEGWPLGRTGRGVLLALDHHRPRRLVDSTPVALGTLTDDERGVTAGEHWLTLAAVDEASAVLRGTGGSRAPWAAVRFWVGERRPGLAPEPRVTLLSPSGTLNGGVAADSAVIDFLGVPFRLGSGGARVSVAGSFGRVERSLDAWEPVAVSGLPSGDVTVEVELVGDGGGARTARVISVNRELGPVSEP
jgi:hypothetical protein